MSAREYLATTWRPDRELLDSQLVERNVGEYDHGNLQGSLIFRPRSRQCEWQIRAVPEQRIGISAGRFPIPDVCVVARAQAVEPVFIRPPLLCLEILSKDDALRGMPQPARHNRRLLHDVPEQTGRRPGAAVALSSRADRLFLRRERHAKSTVARLAPAALVASAATVLWLSNCSQSGEWQWSLPNASKTRPGLPERKLFRNRRSPSISTALW